MNEITTVETKHTDLATIIEQHETAAREIAAANHIVVGCLNPHVGLAELRGKVAKFEQLVSTGDMARIAIALAYLHTPAPRDEIKHELALLIASFPNGGGNDLSVFGKLLVAEVEALKPSRAALVSACRELRRNSRFVPTICEVIAAVNRERDRWTARGDMIPAWPKALEDARRYLASAESDAEKRERERQSQIERRTAKYGTVGTDW